MNPLDFIPKSLLGIAIIALLTTNFSCAVKNGQLELEVSRAATKLAQAEAKHVGAVLEGQLAVRTKDEEYRKKERALQAVADTERKKNEALFAIADTDAAALRLRLSGRTFSLAASPASIDPDTSAYPTARVALAGSGDEQELFIGTQLVDEASRAEKIRISLLSCYKQYDEAVLKINGGE